MAKVYFRYGAMGSSKTANAMMVAFNYKERDQNALLLKPALENRDGDTIIRSRIGLSGECETVEDFLERFDPEKDPKEIDCLIVDEAQFLTKEQVHKFCEMADVYNIPVICYGLRTDFKGNLFEGSTWLLAWADAIEEVKTICSCGKKATMNARFDENGKIFVDGPQIEMGANDKYFSLCRKCFNKRIAERMQELNPS